MYNPRILVIASKYLSFWLQLISILAVYGSNHVELEAITTKRLRKSLILGNMVPLLLCLADSARYLRQLLCSQAEDLVFDREREGWLCGSRGASETVHRDYS